MIFHPRIHRISHIADQLFREGNMDPNRGISVACDSVDQCSYRRRLVPREGVILQYEPVLDPSFCPRCFLIKGSRFQYLVLEMDIISTGIK